MVAAIKVDAAIHLVGCSDKGGWDTLVGAKAEGLHVYKYMVRTVCTCISRQIGSDFTSEVVLRL